jgi:hypothetical protein
LADRNEAVLERVTELLGKYPKLSSKQLFDMAIRMDPAIEEPGLRSFNARYVLPVKRDKARSEGRLPKPRARKAATKRAPEVARTRHARPRAARTPWRTTRAVEARSRVRDALLRFARELAAAESRAALVDALAGIEAVVDEVLDAAAGRMQATGSTQQETESGE